MLRAQGFHGTTTHDIACRAIFFQPYLYRLFVSKEVLSVGVVQLVSDMMTGTAAQYVSENAPTPRSSAEGLYVVRAAYVALIENRDVMMFLMHAVLQRSPDMMVRRSDEQASR